MAHNGIEGLTPTHVPVGAIKIPDPIIVPTIKDQPPQKVTVRSNLTSVSAIFSFFGSIDILRKIVSKNYVPSLLEKMSEQI